jgi:hypothetical protein
MYGFERDLQDVITAHPELFFPGGDQWRAVDNPPSAGRGRLDVLFEIGDDRYAVVEVKREQAREYAVDQVRGYAAALRSEYRIVQRWVAAHIIPDAVQRYGASKKVQTCEIRPKEIEHLLKPRASRKSQRRGAPVPNEDALAELAPAVAEVLRARAARRHYELDSWTNRTYITYRGEDLLGVVRGKGRHIFVTPSRSTREETHYALLAAGFTCKPKRSKYSHPWYHARFDNAQALRRAIRILRDDLRARKAA